MRRIGIIGGTGLDDLEGLQRADTKVVVTPYGDPSGSLQLGDYAGVGVVFLARHGEPHRIPPHLVNYRANLWALKELGVEKVFAVNAVGGIQPEMMGGDLVINDQIIDYTAGREHTFYTDETHHIDFTFPYDAWLRELLIRHAERLGAADPGFRCRPNGVYGCTQGPRLESAAEIRRMARDGCDVVGMTGMPEAALARELDVAYAGVSVVVNAAAGIGEGTVDLEGLEEALATGMDRVRLLLRSALAEIAG